MDIKLLLLMNCVIVANCQSTITKRNDAAYECEAPIDTKTEMESVSQLLMNLQQAAVRNEKEIGEIRQLMLNQQNGDETQTMQEIKSITEDTCQRTDAIHEIVLKHHENETQAIEEMKSKTDDIRQVIVNQHGNETQTMQEMKLTTGEIRQIIVKNHFNETKATQEMKLKIEEIRQILFKQHDNETQTMQVMMSRLEEIRKAVQEQNRPRKGCPPGFDYLSEVGSCYGVISVKLTWNDATERCRQVMPGVHLAAITSQEENNAIVRYLRFNYSSSGNCVDTRFPGIGNRFWIGGQTRNPRQCGDPYVWKPLRGIEIPFTYTNWRQNSPDCYKSEEHCVDISAGNNYMWNDYICDSLLCAICELHV